MKRYIAAELSKQSEKMANFAQTVRQLERKLLKKHNQDLSLTVSHKDESGVHLGSGLGLQSTQDSKARKYHKNPFFASDAMTASEDIPLLRNQRELPAEMVQDFFFQCIESLVKMQKSSQQKMKQSHP